MFYIKIGLINFHYAYNYGAVLQCMALKLKLENFGHEVVVIDYRPSYQQQYYRMCPNPFSAARWAFRFYRHAHTPLPQLFYHTVGRFLRVVLSYREITKRHRLKQAFRSFTELHLSLSRRYTHLEQLIEDPPLCEVYICGSDQLWNPWVTWGLDPAYFLNFGRHESRRFAYAISPCMLDTAEYSVELRTMTSQLDAISLREVDMLRELETITGMPISVCPDPTLFWDSEVYNAYEDAIPQFPGGYIFVYAFKDKDNDKLLFDKAQALQKETGFDIVDASLDRLAWPFVVKSVSGVTPGQFLSYIRNAGCIITNSFHGTVFSILYQKEFYTIPKGNTHTRMDELLDKMGLYKQMINTDQQMQESSRSIPDYTAVREGLLDLRAQGEYYLKQCLNPNFIGDG